MLTRNWPRHLLCLSLCLPLGSVLACGPDFPNRLLDDRAQTLADLPAGNFKFEISRLGKAIAGLKNVTAATHDPDDMYGDENAAAKVREQAENAGLSSEQAALVMQLRGLTDAHQVEEQGASLPAEIRLYVAGAVAFATGEHQQAVEYFNKLLALPADQRPLRSTWAAYSLGRTWFAMSREADAAVGALEQSLDAFRQTRQMSIDGFSDPLELGVASLGEEARVLRTAGNWNGAIELYEAQNLHGSAVGYTSLKQLVNELAELPETELTQLLQRKAVQQLVTASLVSRLGWSYGEEPTNEKKLIKLLQTSTRGSLENADRLAAMNYQQGDYASAKAFLESAGDGGLAWWLRAKLAVRDGDKNAAAAAYAKAAQAFPQNEDWGYQLTTDSAFETVKPKCRVEGESAILALQRGEYLQAFVQLYRSNSIYWFDAATVAERVLTVEELKRYVDENVPASAEPIEDGQADSEQRRIGENLRYLLARRLLREGHYAEAVDYFVNTTQQEQARYYGEQRLAAENAWWPTKRATALFNAAIAARESGFGILGYEMAPDYVSFGGFYYIGNKELQVGPLVSEDEVQRQTASEALTKQRFHYRSVATELANRAADNLPHTSQAFAAVLCKAAGFNSSVEEQKALYLRYVKEGPYVPWAENFGRQCEKPDFENADKRYVTQVTDAVRSSLRPYKWPVQIGAIVLAVGAALLLITRRQRKARKG